MLPDFPYQTMVGILQAVARNGEGLLRPYEDEFYSDLKNFYRRYVATHQDAIPKVSAWPHAVAQAAALRQGGESRSEHV